MLHQSVEIDLLLERSVKVYGAVLSTYPGNPYWPYLYFFLKSIGRLERSGVPFTVNYPLELYRKLRKLQTPDRLSLPTAYCGVPWAVCQPLYDLQNGHP